jgi:hypothetical protein
MTQVIHLPPTFHRIPVDKMMRHITPLLIAAVATSATIGCAKSDSHAQVSQAGGADDGPPVVTITATDNAYQAPDTIQSGFTTFHLVNEGPSLHHAVIARLDSGKTLADLEQAIKHPGPLPRWAVLLGGPNAPDPKAESNATLELQPGNYAIVCFVDLPGGVPHFAKGMIKGLTVVQSTRQVAAAPVADDSITLSDYAFQLGHPMTAGTHTFRVINGATQPHEVELVKLAPGKTTKDMLAFLAAPNGPPPGNAIGGSTPAVAGAPVWFTADITPGNYLFICFMPDAKDGKPHFMHGMSMTQTVQ